MGDAFEEWLATRPEFIQKLAAEFPLGSMFELDGATMFLVGYGEPDHLLISHINPSVDYDGALESRVVLCASHCRGHAHD